MRYAILGTTQALRDDGTPVELAGGRLRALLTALALRPGRVVGADTLIGEVWDGDPPAGGIGALQALVGRLRKTLGHDAVGSVEGGYRLAAEPDDIDLHRFQRLADEGARALADGDPVKAAGLLADALALWRGPALADLPDRATAAVRSESLRVDAVRHRLTAELALGHAGRVLPELAGLAAAYPLDEPLRALYIRALRATGRTADALAAYEAVRHDLADRLGTDPSAELRSLYAELLQPEPAAGPPPGAPSGPSAVLSSLTFSGPGIPPGPDAVALTRTPGLGGGAGVGAGRGGAAGPREAAGPSWAAGTSDPAGTSGTGTGAPGGGADTPAAGGARTRPGRPPGNARARLTSFVGRERELAAVRGDLARARLVTITGPGGTGKTRLSQETGDLLAEQWADGVWYAELAPVSDPRTVPEAVISSLGLRETLLHSGGAAEAAIAAEAKYRDPVRQLADYCASRTLLLVLDNCEHVIDAAAALAERLLADCPGVSVLATSREPLGVPGELVRPLDPLPDPTALRLLADRGAAARPGFTVDDDPVACAELCRRLDGLPLAIELAAARLRGLSPRQLADRLDDRFRLLTGGSRTLLPRQQTLRAVVDWSWDLLDPAERVLLRRLAVFHGGWTLEAAESICSDPADSGPAAGTPAAGALAARTPAGHRPGEDPPAAVPPGGPPTHRADTHRADRGGPHRDRAAAFRIEAPDAAALLASLVDKSLVLADLTDDGSRYRMLETIAEYAAERLDESGERPAVEGRHIAYFRAFVRTADPGLRGAGQLVWFERMEREHENLRAALRRAVAARDEQEALLLTLGCAWFWEVRNYVSERRRWPAAVAALGPDPFEAPATLEPVPRGPLEDPPPLEGERLLEARRWVRVVELTAMDDYIEWWTDPRMAAVGRAVIDAYPPHLPQSARAPGILRPYAAFFAGDFARLRDLMDETVTACRTHGRPWELAFSLQMRAKVNNDFTERMADALVDIEESRRIFERLGDEWGMAETLAAEAEAASNTGDWQRAAVCCREGMALARKIGSHQHAPVFAIRLGDALINCGEQAEGERVLREGIAEAEGFGSAPDGSAFFGKILLANALRQRGGLDEAMDIVDGAIRAYQSGEVSSGLPGFIDDLLHVMKGFLVGKAGDPAAGLALLTAGVADLAEHPMAAVIAPRLCIQLVPPTVELLVLLAEQDGGTAGRKQDGGQGRERDREHGQDQDQDQDQDREQDREQDRAEQRAVARARRAVVLAGAHDRLRHSAIAPAEARDYAALKVRIRALLGDEEYEAAYAEGGGLSTEETVALMRDLD